MATARDRALGLWEGADYSGLRHRASRICGGSHTSRGSAAAHLADIAFEAAHPRRETRIKVHIVIVGDEVGRADGLQRELDQALADFGLSWDVRWVAPDDAQSSLAGESPVDVLVCELDAGARRAAALLSQLRSERPEAVRILLLENGQDADALQALDSAHRLLRKPLDA